MTQPTPTLSRDELNQAIVDAYREYIATARARPRNQQAITDAKAAVDDLTRLRAELYP